MEAWKRFASSCSFDVNTLFLNNSQQKSNLSSQFDASTSDLQFTVVRSSLCEPYFHVSSNKAFFDLSFCFFHDVPVVFISMQRDQLVYRSTVSTFLPCDSCSVKKCSGHLVLKGDMSLFPLSCYLRFNDNFISRTDAPFSVPLCGPHCTNVPVTQSQCITPFSHPSLISPTTNSLALPAITTIAENRVPFDVPFFFSLEKKCDGVYLAIKDHDVHSSFLKMVKASLPLPIIGFQFLVGSIVKVFSLQLTQLYPLGFNSDYFCRFQFSGLPESFTNFSILYDPFVPSFDRIWLTYLSSIFFDYQIGLDLEYFSRYFTPSSVALSYHALVKPLLLKPNLSFPFYFNCIKQGNKYMVKKDMFISRSDLEEVFSSSFDLYGFSSRGIVCQYDQIFNFTFVLLPPLFDYYAYFEIFSGFDSTFELMLFSHPQGTKFPINILLSLSSKLTEHFPHQFWKDDSIIDLNIDSNRIVDPVIVSKIDLPDLDPCLEFCCSILEEGSVNLVESDFFGRGFY